MNIITVFEDFGRKIDNVLIVSTEIKFFTEEGLKKHFKSSVYGSLGQVLSYSIFGFDGLSLWHLFQKDIEDDKIQSLSKTTKEILSGFKFTYFLSLWQTRR